MWGRGDTPAQGEVASLENAIAADNADLADGLVVAKMDQERRALRMIPKNLTWRWLDDISLELSFELPAGAYATTVVRELART